MSSPITVTFLTQRPDRCSSGADSRNDLNQIQRRPAMTAIGLLKVPRRSLPIAGKRNHSSIKPTTNSLGCGVAGMLRRTDSLARLSRNGADIVISADRVFYF